MDFSFTGLSFGDFSGLTPEENQRIKNILLRPKQSQPPNGPEFPWSEEEFRSSFGIDYQKIISDGFAKVLVVENNSSDNDTSLKANPNNVFSGPAEMECESGDSTGNIPDKENTVNASSIEQVVPEVPPVSVSVSVSAERRSSLGRKTYERRNKKKRPPGYYEAAYNHSAPVESSVNIKETNELEKNLSLGPSQSQNAFLLGDDKIDNFISQTIPTETNHIEQLPHHLDLDNSTDTKIRTINVEQAAKEDLHVVQDDVVSMSTPMDYNDIETDVAMDMDTDVIISDNVVGDLNNVHDSPEKTISHICDTESSLVTTKDVVSDSVLLNQNLNSLGSDENFACETDLKQCANSAAVNNDLKEEIDTKISATEDSMESKDTCTDNVIEKPKVTIPGFPWSSLFKNKTDNAAAQRKNLTCNVTSANNISDRHGYSKNDQNCKKSSDEIASEQLRNLLQNVQLNHRPVSLQPRGLSNRGNWCYVNATLQALLACPPFYHLIKSLPSFPALTTGPTTTPVIDSIVEFVNEFISMRFNAFNSGSKGKKENTRHDISSGTCFEPIYVYNMLQNKSDTFKHGKQEDAEEFLSFLLNGIHEEMVAVDKPSQDDKADSKENNHEVTNGYGTPCEDDEDNWEQVGPKKKSMITRCADIRPSLIAAIFCGQMRSVLHQPGSRESATSQPFFTLQLDIQSDKIWSVKDALEGLLTHESLQGYTCSKTKTEVDASRRLMLDVLPPVLILHLKYFVYNKDGGCQKIHKKIEYMVDLEINKDLLSPITRSKLNSMQRSYKLFAVEYHHGRYAAGGHYTVDVFHPGIQGWIHIDDSNVNTIPLSQVLKHQAGRVPYLLYYRRCDLLSS